MSRNSKNARRYAMRKQWAHAKFDGKQSVSTGFRGPAQTTPKHGKRNAWFQQFDSHGDFMRSQKKGGRRKEKDSEAA